MSRSLVSRISPKRQYNCLQCSRRELVGAPTRRTFHSSKPWRRRNDSVLGVLEERGLVNQIAGDRNGLEKVLQQRKAAIYAGIDPTAPSLHLGHLLPLMVLFWMSLYGHKVVSLVGGGTARVGDPSGRLTSRADTAADVQRSNFEAMFEQTGELLKSVKRYARRHGYREQEIGEHRLLDNAEWLDKLNVLDFLKMLGNGMRIGTMLGRDTVRNKMEQGDGMSFSEFTYPLLQGWDWWHMYQKMDVQIQVGGSDQYGNIVAGMDAVRYIAQSRQSQQEDIQAPMGLTVPLLTTSSGEKFGKSAGNAIWLDRSMTSPFDLYGFLLRSADADVERYLKIFTFVPTPDISTIMEEHNADPGKRRAQHLLASEVLEMIHGREEAEKTRSEHQMLRKPSLASLSSQATVGGDQLVGQDVNRITLPKSNVLNTPISHILYRAGLVKSKSEGSRMIEKGGLYVASNDDNADLNFVKIKDQSAEDVASLLVDNLLIFRLGKWKVRVIEVVDDDLLDHTKMTPTNPSA